MPQGAGPPMSILFSALAALATLAFDAVPDLLPKGIVFDGQGLVSPSSLQTTLFFAAVLFISAAGIAEYLERRNPPPGGPPSGGSHNYSPSGDQPRPLSPKNWGPTLISGVTLAILFWLLSLETATNPFHITIGEWIIISSALTAIVIPIAGYIIFKGLNRRATKEDGDVVETPRVRMPDI